MSKKRILLVNEAHYLNTGYAVFGKEMLDNWHNSGKYEICELAIYGSNEHPQARNTPWKFIGVMPEAGNKQQHEIYERDGQNQFGKWKFEQTCIDFKPDVVVSIADPWQMSFLIHSPFKRYYSLIWMPTCDAYPQSDSWLHDIMSCDGIMTYTEFAKDVLKEQTRGQVKWMGLGAIGANLNIFKPVLNKIQHKKNMRIPEDQIIIGMVGRNQMRKRFPELFIAFADLLKRVDKDIAKRLHLYIHTGYPDVGWKIPDHLKESGISHKVYFTYCCKNCGFISGQKYNDVSVRCPRCGQNTFGFTSPGAGAPTEIMAQIYNLMDIYVQYISNGGLEIPCVEAAACGVPVLCTDYSSTEDFKKTINAVPINCKHHDRECSTNRYMGIPDKEDFITKIIDIIMMPSSMRNQLGLLARQGCEQHYNSETVCNTWMQVMDSFPTGKWNSPKKIFTRHLNAVPPKNCTNEEFVKWAIINIADEPKLLNTWVESKMIQDLNYGFRPDFQGFGYFNDLSSLGGRPNKRSFNRENLVQELKNLVEYKNFWEQKRI